MSLTLSAIREAIGNQLRNNLTGAPGNQVNVDVDGEGAPMPRIRLELQPSDPIDYWLTMNGSTGNGVAEVRFNLIVEVAGVDQSAVQRLDKFLSVGTNNGESIVDALLASKTLGDVVETIHISGVSEYDAANVTATLPLRVVCRKQGANA